MNRTLYFALAFSIGCSTPASPPADVASTDVAPPPDVVTDRAMSPDVAPPDVAPLDASPVDATTDVADVTDVSVAMGDILGTLRGTCQTLRTMLASPAPSLLANDLTFMAPERYERASLSPGGQRLFDTPNAGGSSTESEVMSYEILHFCEGASLRATETEIRYMPVSDAGANSITDLLVEIDGMRVGVSVTRVYRPAPMVLSDMDVADLLTRKLEGINRSSVRVLPIDRWVKQVLHVFVANTATATQVQRVWATLTAGVRADTIIELTTTRGGGFIYCNPDPALGSECPSLP
jgi:hypothetical protein